jgi:hypothetical protein
MFYLPNPIRGGIAAFRVEDDAKKPPDFVVFRRSANWTHWPVYMREANRYTWTQISLNAPDIPWSNNPDPSAMLAQASRKGTIYIARRMPDSKPETPKSGKTIAVLGGSGPSK